MYLQKVLQGSSLAFFGFLKARQLSLHPLLDEQQLEELELEEEELELESQVEELDLQLLLLDGQV